MNIVISSNVSKPIYEQITSQIKAMIMNGQLRAGDAIPSMRALAKSLHVSVITVQRAYEELSAEGFIETIVGKGTFVAGISKEFYQEQKQREIEEYLMKASEIAKSCGISAEQLAGLLKLFYEEDGE